ncbi:MAG: helix-hairpin-helix domain-containing protein [Thiobacillus sp.]|nr:helix-hairpin-helix domain-containing protein [Thiobacillus sp.]
MKKLFAALLLGLTMSVSALAAVDLNKATQSELESVKGIGPAKAKAIVTHREKNGAFKSVDDLAQVKGFGKSSVAKLKDQLMVGEAQATSKK